MANDLEAGTVLAPTGGRWHGLLFENPRTSYPLALTWSFEFTFEPLMIEDERKRVALTVEWVPLGHCDWRRLAGHRLASPFADPIESSFYLYEHCCFDRAEIAIVEQEGSRLRASARAEGDRDHLGLDVVEAEAVLAVEGIYVQPHARPGDVHAAARVLAEFTPVEGLVGVDKGHNYLFAPAEHP